MSKRNPLSFLNSNALNAFWVFLFLVIFIPTSGLYGQDPDDIDDVEEFWGDDEYEDEYEDDEEYLDDEYDEYEDDDEYDDEYEDEDEYEDDEEYEDDDEYEDEFEDDEIDDTELADAADNLGYTIDIAGGSPRFVNMNLQDWASGVDLRASVEFPVLMSVLGARFRFGAEVGTFKFQHDKPPATGQYSGITAMGLIAFPAGPGKIKVGLGMVGTSPGFMMEASYGIRLGGILDLRGGIRSTEVMNGKPKNYEDSSGSTVESIGRTGWMDGVILLGINF